MIEEKYVELVRYLQNMARRNQMFENRYEDIVQNTLEVLIIEERSKPFASPRELWGRATNVMRDEIAKAFAAALAVSGVKRQAHYYASKYLRQSDYNPYSAYDNQTETPRVSLDLLKIVAGGTGQTDPTVLPSLSIKPFNDASSLSLNDEKLIQDSVKSLPTAQRTIVEMYVGLGQEPRTLKQIAFELDLPLSEVKSLWRTARGALRRSLDSVLS